MKIEKRIRELKLTLVELNKSFGSYVPAVQYGNIITTSGQLPFADNRLVHPGRVGQEVSVENAQRAAKIAVMNALSAIKSICKDLDRVEKIIRLNAFILSAVSFQDQPKVMNPTSELLIEIFGEKIGQHTRVAVGAFELPMNSCVELDLTVQISKS